MKWNECLPAVKRLCVSRRSLHHGSVLLLLWSAHVLLPMADILSALNLAFFLMNRILLTYIRIIILRVTAL